MNSGKSPRVFCDLLCSCGDSWNSQPFLLVVENISSALSGIAASGEQKSIAGLALYCEWEMTPEKWKTWREKVQKNDENPQRQKEPATVSGRNEKKNGK